MIVVSVRLVLSKMASWRKRVLKRADPDDRRMISKTLIISKNLGTYLHFFNIIFRNFKYLRKLHF